MTHQQRWRPIGLLVVALTLALIPLGTRPAYAYCGYGSDTYYQDCIIEDALDALGTAPTRSNTPEELAMVERYFNLQTQQNEAAVLEALRNLPEFDQEFAYYQRVVASGGDPNVFFGQSGLPSLGGNVFLDPFYAGPGMPGFGSYEAFTPSFLNSLHNFQSSLSSDSAIDYTPTLSPGSCTSPDFFQATTVTFYNYSAQPVLASIIDARCQEVPYMLIPSNYGYISITFVGQTWSVRNGITGDLLQGSPYYSIPNTWPQSWTITDGPNGLQMYDGSSESGGSASLAATPDVPTLSSDGVMLAKRMSAMYQRQADQVYSDPALQALQAEASAYFQNQIYNDPQALYLLQELNTLRDQVRSASPDYAEAQALAAEIATWASAPKDDAILRARYAQRMRLQLLSDHVDRDEETYLLTHPDIAARLNDISKQLQQRSDDLRHAPESLIWQANWQKRWDIAYYTSNRGVAETQDLLDIQARNPTFAEYQQLNNEMGNLMPSLHDTAPIQHVANLQQQADSNLDIRTQLRGLSDTFHAASLAALEGVGATPILEQFYEQVNALGLSDAAYLQLRSSGEAAVGKLDTFRAEVHAAVAACYARSDEACDLSSDYAVQSLMQSRRAGPLVAAATKFYQEHDAFWYGFYRGQAYLSLENQAKVDLKAPLSAAESALDAARAAYDKAQADIPALAALQTAQTQIYDNLCSSAQLNALPVGDPAAEVCGRLKRMAELADSLVTTSPTNIQAMTQTIYLPLVRR